MEYLISGHKEGDLGKAGSRILILFEDSFQYL